MSVLAAAHTPYTVPVAMMEPMRPASRAEERAILEMIDSGVLQPARKTGSIREWKWKSARIKAA